MVLHRLSCYKIWSNYQRHHTGEATCSGSRWYSTLWEGMYGSGGLTHPTVPLSSLLAVLLLCTTATSTRRGGGPFGPLLSHSFIHNLQYIAHPSHCTYNYYVRRALAASPPLGGWLGGSSMMEETQSSMMEENASHQGCPIVGAGTACPGLPPRQQSRPQVRTRAGLLYNNTV